MKPILTFESLTLSTNVASGCSLLSSNHAQYVCPVTDAESGWTLFSDDAVCVITPEPGDQICYDIPIANSHVFSS